MGIVDFQVLARISDLRTCYQAITFMVMILLNTYSLTATLILMGVVVVETKNTFNGLLAKKYLDYEDLEEVIELWDRTCAALSVPFFVLFSCNQVLVTLVTYVCMTGIK